MRVRAHDGHADDVAVLTREALQGTEGIVANIEREAENGQAFRTGRRVGSVGGHFEGMKLTLSTRNTQHKTS